MTKIISEDSLRRSLARMSAEQSQDWLRPQLLASVQAALGTPWILDIDTTIKDAVRPAKRSRGGVLRLRALPFAQDDKYIVNKYK